MYKISNSQFEVKITKTGVEVCSFVSKETNIEYIWQGNPDVWGSHAPVLFPIIGGLKDNGYIFEGKEYRLPKHGFIRHSEKLKLIFQSESEIVFSLIPDEEIKAMYPFDFEFLLTYKLSGNQLSVNHQVINKAETEMYFSLGGHPAFCCPRNKNEKYEDYFLEFEEIETDHTYRVLPNGLIGNDTEPILENTNILPLHKELFIKDALVFKNLKSRKCSLKSHKSNTILSIEYPDFPYLGIWAKPNGEFICIEPWIGIADSQGSNREFTQKEGLLILEGKKEFTTSYYISIEE